MPQLKIEAPNGKTYSMPWSKAQDPTEEEIDSFIASQEKSSTFKDVQGGSSSLSSTLPKEAPPSVTGLRMEGGKSLWQEANKGTIPVGKMVEPLSESLYKYGESGKPLSTLERGYEGVTGRSPRQEGMYAGALAQAEGNTAESLTSPVNLALTGMTGGTNAARASLGRNLPALEDIGRALFSAKMLGKTDDVARLTDELNVARQSIGRAGAVEPVLRNAGRASGAAMAGNAAYQGISEQDPNQIAPTLLGILGARNPRPISRPQEFVPGNREAGFLRTQTPEAPALLSQPTIHPKPALPQEPINLEAIQPPLNKVELLNASVVKGAVEAKPNIKVISLKNNSPYEVDLINPSQANLSKLSEQGYSPSASNADGSLRLQKIDFAAPNDAGIPSFSGGRRPSERRKELRQRPDSLKDVSLVSQPKRSERDRYYELVEKDKAGTLTAEELAEARILDGKLRNPQLPPKLSKSPKSSESPEKPPEPPKETNLTEKALKIAGTSKALMTGFDLSAPLRQGRMLAHKTEFWKSIVPMVKAAAKEENYVKLQDKIKAGKHYERGENSGLKLTDLSDDLSKREEGIMSNLPEKIPILGKGYRASNRGYTGFLNELRSTTFSSLMDTAKKQGHDIDDVKFTKQVADFVNVATGRGSLNVFEPAAEALNAALFSPRFMASRLKILSPLTYLDPRTSLFVKKEFARSLVQLAGSQSVFLSLAAMGGAQVSVNPTSADFGKLKIGNTRLDTNAGLQQWLKMFAQLKEGKITSSNTGEAIPLNTGKYGSLTYGDILESAVENRTSPIPSLVLQKMKGKNAVGEDFEWTPAIMERLIPLFNSDMIKLAEEDPSFKKMIGFGGPAFFGAGVQTYAPKEKSLFPVPKISQ